LYLGFIAFFELGSVICGAAQSSTMLIIGRAVAGIGASGLMSGGLTIIAASAPLHKRPGKASTPLSFSLLTLAKAMLGILMGCK
jgi:MFS family permease